MTEYEKKEEGICQSAIRSQAEHILEQCHDRVFSFQVQGHTYWVKRKSGNHRNGFAKYSEEKEFYYEIARIRIAEDAVASAPDLILATPSYIVTVDAGDNLGHLIKSDIKESEKRMILNQAGQALAELHLAGLVHGRPALRDIAYRNGHITFIDWESRSFFHNHISKRNADLFLFFQGIFREKNSCKEWVDAACMGYAESGGGENLESLKKFLQKHRSVGRICRWMDIFRMADVEAAGKVYRYMNVL
jgi:tRNA A-37 threonylcarbamoyl transferase component Bud32